MKNLNIQFSISDGSFHSELCETLGIIDDLTCDIRVLNEELELERLRTQMGLECPN